MNWVARYRNRKAVCYSLEGAIVIPREVQRLATSPVYCDFTMADRPMAAQVTTTKDGMARISRIRQYAGARVGSGGPEISIDGLNSNIYIHQKK